VSNLKSITKFENSLLALSFQSKAKELKTAAMIFKDGCLCGASYNGTPEECENDCEIEKEVKAFCPKCKGKGSLNRVVKNIEESNWEAYSVETECEFCEGTGFYKAEIIETSDLTLHAEENVIINCARLGISTKDSTLFTVYSPCIKCASKIIRAQIKRVVCLVPFKNLDGVKKLLENKIDVYFKFTNEDKIIKLFLNEEKEIITYNESINKIEFITKVANPSNLNGVDNIILDCIHKKQEVKFEEVISKLINSFNTPFNIC